MPLASASFAPVSTVPWELRGRGLFRMLGLLRIDVWLNTHAHAHAQILSSLHGTSLTPRDLQEL